MDTVARLRPPDDLVFVQVYCSDVKHYDTFNSAPCSSTLALRCRDSP
jgi:hypothetical protein